MATLVGQLKLQSRWWRLRRLRVLLLVVVVVLTVELARMEPLAVAAVSMRVEVVRAGALARADPQAVHTCPAETLRVSLGLWPRFGVRFSPTALPHGL